MPTIKKILGAMILLLVAIGLVALPQPASSNSPQSGSEDAVPAYHAQAPKDALPATMDPRAFTQPEFKNS
jgi:hypothetical protein